MNFEDLTYLKAGTEKQKKAYKVLTENSVFEKLSSFSPVLTGTIPINVDTDESDLDIICHWIDKNVFARLIENYFSTCENFKLSERSVNNRETVVANFKMQEFKIEIFGQNRATNEQDAFRHMLIEHEILKRRGEDFRLEVVKLKKTGLKTEPAFAKLLDITGDPYTGLLNYKV
jgi:hypothetical protein